MKSGQGWVRRVTLANLNQFVNFLAIESENDVAPETDQQRVKPLSPSPVPSPFAGRSFPLPGRKSAKRRRPKIRISGSAAESVATPTDTVKAAPIVGALIWRKSLSKSDVQKTRPGTNPTGCLRFTQARKNNPNVIDQTTFFREAVFGGFKWITIKRNPYEEEATVRFVLLINGETIGEEKLAIRHKPSGEAGQGNYTTSLHWGPWTNTIRDRVSPNELLTLYEPPQGQSEPFTIKIGA